MIRMKCMRGRVERDVAAKYKRFTNRDVLSNELSSPHVDQIFHKIYSLTLRTQTRALPSPQPCASLA